MIHMGAVTPAPCTGSVATVVPVRQMAEAPGFEPGSLVGTTLAPWRFKPLTHASVWTVRPQAARREAR